jgi:hypothetical protein
MSRMGLGHQVNGFGAYGVDGWAVGFGLSTPAGNKKVKTVTEEDDKMSGQMA